MNKMRQLLGLRTAPEAFASVNLTPGQVSLDKISQLQEHPHLIQALHDWYSMPDKGLLPQLKELAGIVARIEGLQGKLEIYRGFTPGSHTQNTMGYGGTEANLKVADEFMYEQRSTPVSFTTHLDVARTFGKVVIRTEIAFDETCALLFTDELAHLVSMMQDKPPTSQKEVILLPPFSIPCTVLEMN